VDDTTLDSQKYKLVMIGRKVSEDEESHHILDSTTNSQHVLSTDVFHESGEKFQKAIVRDEGIMKHYLRHMYLMVGMIVGVTTFVKLYQMSYQMLPLYEDYVDWVLFEHVKRGRNLSDLTEVFYKSDRYSVEGRSN
jgi:hypothetical protein